LWAYVCTLITDVRRDACLRNGALATYERSSSQPKGGFLTDRRRVEPDAEVLPAPVAERLLKRASELDAARTAGTAVAELRSAAAEAGISVDAFDAALGELQKADQGPSPVSAVATRRWRRLFFGLAGVGAIVLAAATIVIPTRLVAPAAATMVEHIIQLNCLSADKALGLIRPLLTDPANTIVRPGNSSSTLIVRATPEQLRNVRSAIDQVDNAQSCAHK
jgi:type II secretory pathway component GspD/PulD (secretin)